MRPSQMALSTLFLLLWCSGAIFIKLGLESSNVGAFLMLRLLIAWAGISAILLFQYMRGGSPSWRPLTAKPIFLKIVFAGLLLQGFYQLFFFASVAKGVSPGVVVIILGAQPIATTLIVREKLNFYLVSGLLLGFLGLGMVVGNSIEGGSNSIIGISFAALSLIGITIGSIVQSYLPKDLNLLQCLFIQYIPALVLAALCCLFQGFHVEWTLSFLISWLWMGLIVSLFTYYIYFFLIKSNPVSTIARLFYLMPAITACYDYFFFGEQLSLLAFLGMITIIVGLMLIRKKRAVT